jgi:hypothetical protein
MKMKKFPIYSEDLFFLRTGRSALLTITFRDMGRDDAPEFISAKILHAGDVTHLISQEIRDELAGRALEQMEERMQAFAERMGSGE